MICVELNRSFRAFEVYCENLRHRCPPNLEDDNQTAQRPFPPFDDNSTVPKSGHGWMPDTCLSTRKNRLERDANLVACPHRYAADGSFTM